MYVHTHIYIHIPYTIYISIYMCVNILLSFIHSNNVYQVDYIIVTYAYQLISISYVRMCACLL